MEIKLSYKGGVWIVKYGNKECECVNLSDALAQARTWGSYEEQVQDDLVTRTLMD